MNQIRRIMEIHSVGPFIIGKTLGQGTTGKVKLGFHKDTGFKVGIKIINKELLTTKPSMRRKIEREIVLMKLIDHPNAMKMYEVYETSKYLFLILEYVEGGELFDYLVEKGGLESGEALYFFQQIIIGLEHCHSRNICHRDLKPENLLLSGDKRIKIADFGMGSIVRKDALLHTSCGSPHYASPEVVSGIDYDGQKADVWSCGVILYALLTGKLPFDDENIRRLLAKVKNGSFSMPPYIHKDAQDLLTKMLTVDPSKRISIKEIKQHSWFNSNINNSLLNKVNTSAPVTMLEDMSFEPLSDLSAIDDELFRSLMALGLGTIDDVKKSLVTNQKSLPLTYYKLLEERKKYDTDNNKYGVKPNLQKEGGRRNSFSNISNKIFNKNEAQPIQQNYNNNSQHNQQPLLPQQTLSPIQPDVNNNNIHSPSRPTSEGLLKQALQQHHQQQHQQHQHQHQQQQQQQHLQNSDQANVTISTPNSNPLSHSSGIPGPSGPSPSVKSEQQQYQRRGSMTATTNPATSPTLTHRGRTSSPIDITSKFRKLKLDSNTPNSPQGSPIIGSSPKKSFFSFFFSKNSQQQSPSNQSPPPNQPPNQQQQYQQQNQYIIESKIDINLIYVNLEKIARKFGFEYKYSESPNTSNNNNNSSNPLICFIKSITNNSDGTPQFECQIEFVSTKINHIPSNYNTTTTTTTTTTNNITPSDETTRIHIIHKSGSLQKFNSFIQYIGKSV
ncbi:putative protein serine/threonine kinase [Tieghemostelium lacteum]|uniref:Protein kinase domain-containing protein n=1 Tax=Tieghemostelium lacteum TaxID=361077 RepID=A0A152A4K0_TIELA|nr:putative protein serine/threonine kinase [Tieghemostelium lacteum]|eukprot:KYR01005.1 putative protein serine/threonine kinase [Tieghemostelium lacteum]